MDEENKTGLDGNYIPQRAKRDPAREKRQVIFKEILSWVKVVVAAVVISLFINNVVIVNATVPSGSMMNTIPARSRLIALRPAYLFTEPQRFDVVVFRFPDDESAMHVKRIIGMPGEQVEIVDGRVFINGSHEPLDDSFIFEPPIVRAFEQNRVFNVPENSFFVLGDHRNDSLDSRSWVTTSYLPRENILGRAIFVYFPRISLIR